MMPKRSGRLIFEPGSDTGLHNCMRLMREDGGLDFKVGSIWRCTCGQYWYKGTESHCGRVSRREAKRIAGKGGWSR